MAWRFSCDGCKTLLKDVERHKCEKCGNFDLCAACFTKAAQQKHRDEYSGHTTWLHVKGGYVNESYFMGVSDTLSVLHSRFRDGHPTLSNEDACAYVNSFSVLLLKEIKRERVEAERRSVVEAAAAE